MGKKLCQTSTFMALTATCFFIFFFLGMRLEQSKTHTKKHRRRLVTKRAGPDITNKIMQPGPVNSVERGGGGKQTMCMHICYEREWGGWNAQIGIEWTKNQVPRMQLSTRQLPRHTHIKITLPLLLLSLLSPLFHTRCFRHLIRHHRQEISCKSMLAKHRQAAQAQRRLNLADSAYSL